MSGLRLAVFTLVEWSYAVIREWCADAGHEISLLVTQPADALMPGGLVGSTISDPPGIAMVVPRVADCRATLAELELDLAIVFTFRRVPDSVAALPLHGAVNVHPSLLPAFRGPNGYRALFEAEPEIGATLHRLTPRIDAGPVFAHAAEAAPDDLDPQAALEALSRVARAVLEKGVPRALAGEPGEPQDEAAASTASPFADEEVVIPTTIGARAFQHRFAALTLAGRQPELELDGERHPLRAVRRLPRLSAQEAGVVSLGARRAIVTLSDGSVMELELGRPLL